MSSQRGKMVALLSSERKDAEKQARPKRDAGLRVYWRSFAQGSKEQM